MQPSSVTDLLYQQLNFRGEKQKIISSNIANINTPNYKTKDISFDDVLNDSMSNGDLKLKVTNPKHIASAESLQQVAKPKVYEVQGLEEQNDGNNVNLDKQMSEMAKNTIMFNALQSSIKQDNAWMKEVLSSSAKN